MFLLIAALRLIHIFAGVFWAGTAIALAAFIEPAIKAAGPAGAAFMQRLMQHTRFSFSMNLAALLTSLAGVALFWIASGGLQVSWITTGAGLGTTLGGLAGLAAFFYGLLVIGPTAVRMAALGTQMQSAGGPPASSQLSEMATLEARLTQGGLWSAVLLAIAVIGMVIGGLS